MSHSSLKSPTSTITTIPLHSDLLSLPAKQLANMCKCRELKPNGRGKDAYIRALDYARGEDYHVALAKTHDRNVKIMQARLKNAAIRANTKDKLKRTTNSENLHNLSVNTNGNSKRKDFLDRLPQDIPMNEGSSSSSTSSKNKENTKRSSLSTCTYTSSKRRKSSEEKDVHDEISCIADINFNIASTSKTAHENDNEILSNRSKVLYEPVSPRTIEELEEIYNEIPNNQTQYYKEMEMLSEPVSPSITTQEIENDFNNQNHCYQGMLYNRWNFARESSFQSATEFI